MLEFNGTISFSSSSKKAARRRQIRNSYNRHRHKKMMLSLALVCWLLHTIDDICRAWSEYPISSLCVIFPVHFIRSSRAVAGAVWNKLKTWKVSFDLQPGEESVCSLGQRPNAMHITRSEENWVKESMNHENKPFSTVNEARHIHNLFRFLQNFVVFYSLPERLDLHSSGLVAAVVYGI